MLILFRNLFSPPRHMILLVIAVWVGLTFAEKHSDRHGVTKDQINNLIFFSLSGFVLGGRISFVLQNIPAFVKSPLSMISINPDIFDPFGALAAAILISLIFSQKQKISLWNSLDALTPFFGILTIGLGLSHLASGAAFGKETSVAWGINLWNANRHPTQIYETIASLLIFVMLWFKKHEPRRGILFLTFAAVTSASQLFIQAFRGDSNLILNGLRQSQVILWGTLLIIFILYEKLAARN